MDFSIKEFKETIKLLPVTQSVLIRGDHGIGKTGVVASLGSEFNLKVVPFMSAYITGGDLSGVPEIVEDTFTKFFPLESFYECMKNPRILFFDEINRGTRDVTNALLQIILERRTMHKNSELHPETRVLAAINDSSVYATSQLDPALLDRFFVVDLRPTKQEWIAHVRSIPGFSKYIADFHEDQENSWLEMDSKIDASEIRSGKRLPSRRSWTKLGQILGKYEETNKNLIKEKKYPYSIPVEAFQLLCTGFVGDHATQLILEYFKDKKYESEFNHNDILNYKSKRKEIQNASPEQKIQFTV